MPIPMIFIELKDKGFLRFADTAYYTCTVCRSQKKAYWDKKLWGHMKLHIEDC